jgi:glycosyltransferase involved in cell wall biosynthesis
MVAALRPEKRADVFIAAVQHARRSDPRVRGFLVGSGRQEALIRGLAERSGGAVRVLGERGDVPDLLAAADAACLSSSAEALPMAVLEAMALGRPVVATDVGGTAEAVVDGRTGFVVPPGDADPFAHALLKLAADPTLARRLGEAGERRQRERFDGARMVDRYAAVLEEEVARAPARAARAPRRGARR